MADSNGPSNAANGNGRHIDLDEISDVKFEDVSRAKYRIADGVSTTPCEQSATLSEMTKTNLFFKREYLHPTGSFKERGARNALKMLTKEQKQRGVIAASAGNHALGLAYHGSDLGIPVYLVMPLFAPLTKVQNCRSYGANVTTQGAHIGEAMVIAKEMAVEKGLIYINGYDDEAIIAGQGTCALEILEQVPDVDAIVVPIGGAGLIAGIALAVKTLRPEVEVIGVEAESCPSFTKALEAGQPVTVQVSSTLADGLAVPQVGSRAFKVAKDRVDKVVCVREKDVAIAVLRLLEIGKAVVEGAGAAGLAALLVDKLPHLGGKNVVCLLCGGNIDVPVMGRVLERGLAADGRLVKFRIDVPDRPGSIAQLTKITAEIGGSVKDIQHERAWLQTDIHSVTISLVVETRSREHAQELQRVLEATGYRVTCN
eukprot:TRINITY_DN12044_c0_g1_i2.p2 TRINITY_DN12044_c0_g1~~TRINITY_DN12044_c0_g1_i2.p2  ORF type:complete len:427 (+),score=98.17 TRINITY_DN12044_c0_g1_i2:4054-5334(+)